MLNKNKERNTLTKEIKRVVNALAKLEPGTQEYDKVAAHLQKLVETDVAKHDKRLKPDTVAVIAANICIVLLILIFEQGAILNTKPLQFILKSWRV